MTAAVGRTVRECVQLIAEGLLTSEQLVADCLAAIDASEADLGAWAHLDHDHAMSQAKVLDDIRRRGRPLGDLHGIPVGIKDIIDTSDMPTEQGAAAYEGRRPAKDAAVVEKLREAGAVILGKTVTTEFAYSYEVATRNPHDHSRTPGGSSSGSAAAVAAAHVPLALGSQTGGSTIRPAAFCGVYGFKPTRGIISRRGMLATSGTLDQVGLFARDPGDMALLVDVIKGYDCADTLSYLAPRPRMLEGYLSEVPIEPNFVWIDMPYADRYTDTAREGFEELLEVMGGRVERVPAPQSFSALLECHRIISEYELYRCLEEPWEKRRELLSDTLVTAMTDATAHTDESYREALEILEASNDWFREFFNDYDAILTPSALGEAPAAQAGTGDPVCCTLWTLCGLPCINLPLLTGDNDMPIGVQLVGAANEDDRLLRTTRWLLDSLRDDEEE